MPSLLASSHGRLREKDGGGGGLDIETDEHYTNNERSTFMLVTIAIVLIALWLLGIVTSYTMGGFIHILLVIAIIVILVRVISGRRAV